MVLRFKKSRLRVELAVVAVVLVGVLAYGLISRLSAPQNAVPALSQPQTPSEETETASVYYDGQWYRMRSGLQTALLIGVDQYEPDGSETDYRNHQQADFLMLMVADPAAESYTALQLNRDTMAQIPMLSVYGEPLGSFRGQLALAHTYGNGGEISCRNTVKAVSDFLYGVPIDHYVAMTMDAVAAVNDLAGGIRLTLLDDFSGYAPEMAKGAEVVLRGDMALQYVRARTGLADSSNLSRMKRQQQYVEALEQALFARMEEDETFVYRVLETVSGMMITDCTVNDLVNIQEEYRAFASSGIHELAGEAVRGEEFMEFNAEEDALTRTVLELFYEPVPEGDGF